jgi:uncharacterized membrane protein
VERTDLGRIVAFSDGVMAVAITLLVLNLNVPDVGGGELDDELFDLRSSFGAYLLAFLLVGRFWLIHHRLFEAIRAFDDRLAALNLLFLALIALVPFTTDVWDRYSDVPVAAAMFGLVLGLAAFINWAMIRYSLSRNMIHAHRREETRPFGTPVALGFSAVFLLSVPIAFVNVTAAWVLWVSTIVLRYPLRKLGRRTSS